MQRLQGKVAVVTGASRGGGCGIALALGEAGATVYLTGRSIRGRSTTESQQTIDDTADMIAARGGVGIPVRVDHTVDEQVAVLFERVICFSGVHCVYAEAFNNCTTSARGGARTVLSSRH